MDKITIELGLNDLKDGDSREKKYMNHIFTVSKKNGEVLFKVEKDGDHKTKESTG